MPCRPLAFKHFKDRKNFLKKGGPVLVIRYFKRTLPMANFAVLGALAVIWKFSVEGYFLKDCSSCRDSALFQYVDDGSCYSIVVFSTSCTTQKMYFRAKELEYSINISLYEKSNCRGESAVITSVRGQCSTIISPYSPGPFQLEYTPNDDANQCIPVDYCINQRGCDVYLDAAGCSQRTACSWSTTDRVCYSVCAGLSFAECAVTDVCSYQKVDSDLCASGFGSSTVFLLLLTVSTPCISCCSFVACIVQCCVAKRRGQVPIGARFVPVGAFGLMPMRYDVGIGLPVSMPATPRDVQRGQVLPQPLEAPPALDIFAASAGLNTLVLTAAITARVVDAWVVPCGPGRLRKW